MTKKQKRGRFINPVLIVLLLVLVVAYKLELDSNYDVTIHVVDRDGEEFAINNSELREGLEAKTDKVKKSTGDYLLDSWERFSNPK